jgi:phosphatidylglycerophosphatase A
MTRSQNNRCLCLAVAQLGGLGKAPFAPGTVATVVAGIPFVCFLRMVGEPQAFLLVVLLVAVACYCAEAAEKEMGKTDPGEVVVDELVGFLITMLGFSITLESLVLGIVSFRLMDIWKPWPVCILQERLKGGLAIVMDDVAAGILAHAMVWGGLKVWGGGTILVAMR